jgi:hypothetical protein
LAVYGAIGKCLIDRDEFDEHHAMLLQREGAIALKAVTKKKGPTR